MTKFIKRKVDGDSMAVYALGVICYARVGLISKLTIFSCTIYQRADSVRWLFGVKWVSHAA